MYITPNYRDKISHHDDDDDDLDKIVNTGQIIYCSQANLWNGISKSSILGFRHFTFAKFNANEDNLFFLAHLH